MRRFVRAERGAAAVEFALVLIPLIVLLLGIIEFGYIFNQQLTVTNSAREGARVLAITRDAGKAVLAVESAGSTLQGAPTVTTPPPVCSPTSGGDAVVIVRLKLETITGLENWVPGVGTITLEGKGVMPCGG